MRNGSLYPPMSCGANTSETGPNSGAASQMAQAHGQQTKIEIKQEPGTTPVSSMFLTFIKPFNWLSSLVRNQATGTHTDSLITSHSQCFIHAHKGD
jgi:hypothetical protein